MILLDKIIIYYQNFLVVEAMELDPDTVLQLRKNWKDSQIEMDTTYGSNQKALILILYILMVFQLGFLFKHK